MAQDRRTPAGTPASFASPRDVVEDRTLSREAKLRLLTQWERDARELSVAEEEGMMGGEESMLGRVRQALQQLDAAPAEPRRQTTKHGG